MSIAERLARLQESGEFPLPPGTINDPRRMGTIVSNLGNVVSQITKSVDGGDDSQIKRYEELFKKHNELKASYRKLDVAARDSERELHEIKTRLADEIQKRTDAEAENERLRHEIDEFRTRLMVVAKRAREQQQSESGDMNGQSAEKRQQIAAL